MSTNAGNGAAATVQDNVLELRGACFRYPDTSVGLDHCSLTVRRGSRTVVLGANGAGKTTLFLHLNGILRPEQGQVLLNGIPLNYARRELHTLRSAVGLVFQNPDSQLFSVSVWEDVSFGPMNLGLGTAEVRERVAAALAAVDMAGCADKSVHNLSHGQKKRVCIAGVLAMRPEVLVLDEPMAGLDVRMQRGLLELLQRLHREGMTIVMATHDLALARSWADEVVVMDRGTVVCQGTADRVVNDREVMELLGYGDVAGP